MKHRARGSRRSDLAANRRATHDPLIDRTEEADAVRIKHFNSHAVVEAQERRLRLAALHHFKCPAFGNAGGPASAVLVRNGAGTQDRAGAGATGFRDVRDELREIERHVLARVGRTKALTVYRSGQWQVHFVVAPRRS